MTRNKTFLLGMKAGVLSMMAPVVMAADLDQVSWVQSQAPYQCQLEATLPIKSMRVAISAEPEQPVTLELRSTGPYRFAPDTVLSMRTVEWNYFDEELKQELLLSKRTPRYVEVKSNVVEALHWFSLGNQLVVMTGDREDYYAPVGFAEPAKAFKSCMQTLPEISYETGRNAEVRFNSGQSELPSGDDDYLLVEEVARLINYDGNVAKVLIDGYSDSTGDYIENLELSRKRAEFVAVLLAENGVDIDSIEIRAHGSRELKYNERTRSGREKNRRVQIRLIRGS